MGTAKAWLDENQNGVNDDHLHHCSCSSLGMGVIVPDDQLREACHDFVALQTKLALIVLAVAAGVVAINFVVKDLLVNLSSFERPLTVSGLECAIALKVFVAQFLNTAVIVFLINMAFTSSLGFPGEFNDLTSQWYVAVGGALSSALAVNIFSPHCITVFMGKISRWRAGCSAYCCANTEEQIYKAYEPPVFELAPRCGQVLNSIFSTLVFAAGCPSVIWFLFFNLVLTYWCDKWFLCRMAKRPPAFDQRVISAMLGVIPWAVFLYAGFGVLMFGKNEVVPSAPLFGGSQDDLEARFSGSPGWEYISPVVMLVNRGVSRAGCPFFGLMLVVILYFVTQLVKLVLGPAFSLVTSALAQLCCGKNGSSNAEMKRLLLGLNTDEDNESIDAEYLTTFQQEKVKWKKAKICPGYKLVENAKYSAMSLQSVVDLQAYATSGKVQRRLSVSGSSPSKGLLSPDKALARSLDPDSPARMKTLDGLVVLAV